MRIGIEAQRLFRKKKHGMEVVALELIRHLQALDQENEYFIFVKDDEDWCVEETANFRIITVPGLSYPDWEQVHLPRAIKKHQLDVLHCTCNTAPLRVDVPLVLTLHDIIYLESVSFSGTAYQNFGNLYRRWVVPQIVKNCQKIITVSHYERQRISQRFSDHAERIEVAYNAVNRTFKLISDKGKLEYYRQKYQLPDAFILYFANPSPKKNALNTLAAYHHYAELSEQPLPLVVADTNRDYIEQALKDLNMGHRAPLIQVIDFIPFDVLPYVYNLASLFLYPSKRESFGMPILEAMACGTPVITSTTSAMPEIAGPAALQVNPLDPLAMGQQIHAVLSDQTLRDKLVEQGQARAKDFTWQRTAQQVLGIYQAVFDSNQKQHQKMTDTSSSHNSGYSKAVDHKRLQFILKQLQRHVSPQGKVLDVGCGNGIMSKAIGQDGYQVLGVDVSEKAIKKAKSGESQSNVDFRVVRAEELVADGSTYDAVICSEVLEHLPNPSPLLATLHALLSDRGVLVVTVPNGRGPRELLITQPMQKLQRKGGRLLAGAEAVKGALGYDGQTEQSAADDLTHVQYFTKNSLRRLLNTHLFKMQAFEHANFLADVFPVSWLANRSYRLQEADCRVADVLPHHFTCGFYSSWTKA